MIEFGKTLRAAREQKGYTIAQIAERTRMLASIVEDLEREDFSHLAAPIYGRGFVKLYCEVVGLDPKPMVEEFMEIFNGNREPTIKEREVASAPEPVEAAVTPEPAAVIPEPANDLFTPPPPPPPPSPVPPPSEPMAPIEEPTPSRFARYATPMPDYAPSKKFKFSAPAIPAAVWRFAILALGATAILALLSWLVVIGYRAAKGTPAARPDTAIATPAMPKTPADAAPSATPRSPQKIPDLYLD